MLCISLAICCWAKLHTVHRFGWYLYRHCNRHSGFATAGCFLLLLLIFGKNNLYALALIMKVESCSIYHCQWSWKQKQLNYCWQHWLFFDIHRNPPWRVIAQVSWIWGDLAIHTVDNNGAVNSSLYLICEQLGWVEQCYIRRKKVVNTFTWVKVR